MSGICFTCAASALTLLPDDRLAPSVSGVSLSSFDSFPPETLARLNVADCVSGNGLLPSIFITCLLNPLYRIGKVFVNFNLANRFRGLSLPHKPDSDYSESG